jgi:hypothetical protein
MLVLDRGLVLDRIDRIADSPEPFPLCLREEATSPHDVGRALHEEPDVLGVRRLVELAFAFEEILARVPDIPDRLVLVDLRGRVPAARLPPEHQDVGRLDLHPVRDHQVVVMPLPGDGADLGDGDELDRTSPPLADRLDERLPPFDDPDVIGRRGGQHRRVQPNVGGLAFEEDCPDHRQLE